MPLSLPRTYVGQHRPAPDRPAVWDLTTGRKVNAAASPPAHNTSTTKAETPRKA